MDYEVGHRVRDSRGQEGIIVDVWDQHRESNEWIYEVEFPKGNGDATIDHMKANELEPVPEVH